MHALTFQLKFTRLANFWLFTFIWIRKAVLIFTSTALLSKKKTRWTNKQTKKKPNFMKQPTIKPWNEVTGDLGDLMATEQSPYLGYSSQQQLSSPIRYLTDVTQSNKTTPWYEQIKASQRHLCSQVMRVHFICVCVGESLREGLLLPTFFFPPHQTFSPKCQTARYSYRAIYCAVWTPKPYHSLIYNHDVIHRIWGKKSGL